MKREKGESSLHSSKSGNFEMDLLDICGGTYWDKGKVSSTSCASSSRLLQHSVGYCGAILFQYYTTHPFIHCVDLVNYEVTIDVKLIIELLYH